MYVDEKLASVTVVPPTPSQEGPTESEAKIWEASHHLPKWPLYRVRFLTYTNTSQIKIILPLDLMVKAEAEAEEVPVHNNQRCCPGFEEQSQVNCALALDSLAEVTNDVADRQDALEQEVYNLSCLAETVNENISPMMSQATAMTTWANGIVCENWGSGKEEIKPSSQPQ
ncbi:hypothetical protein DSO57_1014139 [Entomophthora muscae]|uniref:Uncharacterized protein n=1 Tax=Entomophthora muscae TaxID=34485 RepID=A0ACC2S796_9FUNG|nr:hypothetical protein DSO57_1014139 [Entomophthora muscae]